MGKEELVEMINSTINTNGSGAITGEALNLALQAIVETMGTGSGAERLQGYFDGSAWQQTEDEKALNAQLYTKIVSAIENGEQISVWARMASDFGNCCLTSTAVAVAGSMVMALFYASDVTFYPVLSSDGSVQIRG